MTKLEGDQRADFEALSKDVARETIKETKAVLRPAQTDFEQAVRDHYHPPIPVETPTTPGRG